MKLLEYSKNRGSVEGISAQSLKAATFQFEPKGNGTFKGIVPMRLAAGVVRNTAITLTTQAQTTQAGATRLLLKVDVPYAAEPVDALGDGVYREYGAVSAHIVITVPRRAAQDLGGSNGSNATTNARRQADYAQALLLRLLGPVFSKDARMCWGVNNGDANHEFLGFSQSATSQLVADGSVLDEDISFMTRRLPNVPQQEENEVELDLGNGGDANNPYAMTHRMASVVPSPVSVADKTSDSDPTAVVDLTVNTTGDDTVGFGPMSMLTRAIAGLSPISDDAVLTPPTFLRIDA